MRHVRILLALVLGLSANTVLAAQAARQTMQLPQEFHLLSGPQQVTPIALELLNGDPANVELRMGEPMVERGTIEMNGEVMTTISLPSEGTQLHAGYPDLPRVTRMVLVAPHGNVSAELVHTEYRTEILTRRVAPKASLDESRGLDAVALAEVYAEDAFWPPQVVEISEPMLLRDARVVVLIVNPVQYNPVTGELRIFEQLDLAVRDAGGTGLNEQVIEPVSLTPGFKKLYSSLVNFEHSALDDLPVMPGNQLIICQNDPTVISYVNTLATWRKKKGIDATIVTTATTGSTPSLIRNYINTQYTNSNGQLEFVLVIGDADGTGAYYFPTDGLSEYPYGELDNLYGLMGAGPNPDPLPDLGIGRLPASDADELVAMVTKSVNYEANPFMTDTTWFTRTWTAVHNQFIPSNPSTKEYTRQMMLQRGMNPGAMTIFPSSVVPSVLEQRVNAGVAVVNHRLGWGNSEMNPPDLNGLANGRMLPFVAVITCGMGWYNNGESVTEAWVRRGTSASPVGAIGAMGMAGNSTRVAENNIVDGGAMMGLLVKDIREQSLVMVNGKLELFRNFWDNVSQASVEEFSAWCNLMGDPAVPIFLNVPRTIQASFPQLVNRYTDNVTVQVTQDGQPHAGALVGLYKSTGVFARGYTDASGNINLAATLSDTGWVYVTVTGTDLKTIRDSLHVINAAASLAQAAVTVDDNNLGGTQGNGDGVLNPGEIVDLSISLINRGTSQTATGINGVLSSATTAVQVTSANSSYPNLAVGQTAASNSAYRITVGAVQDAEPVALFLDATSSAGLQEIRVNLTPVAGNVAVTGANFLSGDLQLDPGDSGALSVVLQNTGGRAFTNASAILRSKSVQLAVMDSVGGYGAVAIGGSAENTANAFAVATSLNTVAGFAAVLELVVTDVDGFRDSVEFVRTIGVSSPTSPTGPDAYGYYAFDDAETQPAGVATQYDWQDISVIGANIGFNDQVEDGDDTAVRSLPFDFTFYGNTFDSVTICSNGWLSFGNHGNMWDFRNWHIGSPLGPPNLVAAYWDDLATTGGGVYYYYDALAQRFIVQWNVVTLWTSVPQVFQVVLYNPDVYPSPTGDGKILVQYQTCTPDENSGAFDMPWATVGIQNENHSDGLEYCFANAYTPGSAALGAGRAIVYTTAGSGALFSTLTVLAPDSGDAMFLDSTVTISWFPGITSGTVRIDLSRNGVDGTWETIAGAAPNSGLYVWTVSGASSNNCYLRILSNVDPQESDTSDGAFAIGELIPILSESFESGAPGWTTGSAGGQWVSDWHISTERAQTGASAYKCGDAAAGTYRQYNDAFLVSPVIAALPPSASLSFAQQHETEISGAFPDSAYDGGVLEIAVNGGAWEPLTPVGGYNKTFRWQAGGGNPASGPLRGRPCFAGAQTTWQTVQASLAGYAGSSIQLRFRFGSDLLNHQEGWYVDDVQVRALNFELPPPVGLTIASVGTDLVLRWVESGYGTYTVYSGPVEGGPYDTFEGSTSGTSLTIPNGASASIRFFVVVGE